MKFDFWLELPKALVDLSQEEISAEEKSIAHMIEISNNKFNQIMSIGNFPVTLDETEKQILKEKLTTIHREKVQLMCQSIKFSIKLMTRILNQIEEKKSGKEIYKLDSGLLLKIKLFLKLTRLVMDNTKAEISTIRNDKNILMNQPKQLEFFMMIQALTEKVQNKLYSISNEVIKNIITNKSVKSNNNPGNNSENNSTNECTNESSH